MQMINKALEPAALEEFSNGESAQQAGNRHERRAEEARKRLLDKMVADLTAAPRE